MPLFLNRMGAKNSDMVFHGIIQKKTFRQTSAVSLSGDTIFVRRETLTFADIAVNQRYA